jgi:hypothetical protein
MKTITAAEFDEKFDNGEDISEYLDWDKAWRPNERVDTHIDLSAFVTRQLDEEAVRLGITREALIARWIEEKLKGAPWPT